MYRPQAGRYTCEKLGIHQGEEIQFIDMVAKETYNNDRLSDTKETCNRNRRKAPRVNGKVRRIFWDDTHAVLNTIVSEPNIISAIEWIEKATFHLMNTEYSRSLDSNIKTH